MGNLSSILRCAYQNESISSERKGNKELIHIKHPRFAMNVTMTMEQLSSLVNERENGLFSRILFYYLPSRSGFTCPKPKTGENCKKTASTKMKKMVKEWYELLHSEELTFAFSDKQWDIFTHFGKKKKNLFIAQYGDKNTDIIFRTALSSFKIAMVLSAIRLNKIPTDGIVTCLDKDLNSALIIAETLFHHSMMAADILEKKNKKTNTDTNFIKQFSNEFTTKDFTTLASTQGMSERNAMRKLKMLIESNLITKTAHGQYKINKNGK
ncbi:MAG: DUF3987 domain-containing protein [Saprospiraceae bacterium]|nr:DUF3987 domain-containing protein [Saprospiraceae bacterium]